MQSPNPDFSGTSKSLGGTFKHKKAKANIIEKEEVEHQATVKQHKVKANICSEKAESRLSEVTEENKVVENQGFNERVPSTE